MRLPHTEKGEIMQSCEPLIQLDQRSWKRRLQDALFELDTQALRERLQAANKAIEMRRLEITSTANPDSLELAELLDGLHTQRALGFLKESNGALEHR
jgi:hypothetical protein